MFRWLHSSYCEKVDWQKCTQNSHRLLNHYSSFNMVSMFSIAERFRLLFFSLSSHLWSCVRWFLGWWPLPPDVCDIYIQLLFCMCVWRKACLCIFAALFNMSNDKPEVTATLMPAVGVCLQGDAGGAPGPIGPPGLKGEPGEPCSVGPCTGVGTQHHSCLSLSLHLHVPHSISSLSAPL